MKLTELSIKNHITTAILYLLVILGGYMSYQNMEKAEDPGYTVKTTTVTTYWPGATAEQMRKQISDPIAEILQKMPETDYIESKNRDGISTVYYNAEASYWGDELLPIWTKLRKKIYIEATPILPEGIQGPFVNDEYGDVYGTVIGISGKGYTSTELYDEAEKLKNTLLISVPQIGKIEFQGIQSERIYIDYNNSKISELNITPKAIYDALSTRNIIISGGQILKDSKRMTVLATGNYKTIEEIGDTVINVLGSNETIYLRDIAQIKKGYEHPATYKTQVNGEESIMLSIALKDGEDNISLGENVKSLIEDYKTDAPLGMNFDIVAFQPEVVKKKVLNFVSNLGQSIVTVLLVMFLALGLRTGFIVASLIPTAIALTLIIMPHMGLGLNQMTLAGLIIALGMLVDNAIVMSESIMIGLENGKGKYESCLEAASSLKIPLMISSLTTVAAFCPIPMVQETMGEYVGPLATIVMITLLNSYIVAMTLVPMLCYYFLKVDPKEENFETPTYKIYRKILTTILRFKKTSLICVIGMLCMGIGLFSMTQKQFMPDSDKPIMYSVIRLPIGSSIEETEKVVGGLNEYLNHEMRVEEKPVSLNPYEWVTSGGTKKKYEDQGILSWSSYIGGGAPRYTLIYNPEAPAPEYAYVIYNVTDYTLIPDFSKKIDSYLKNTNPDVEAFTQILSTGNDKEKNVEYRISGTNLHDLKLHAKEAIDKLNQIDGAANISENWNKTVRRVVVDIDQDKVRRSGLTSEEVAMTLQSTLQGVQVSTYKNSEASPKNALVPILLRTTDEYRDDITALETIKIYSAKLEKSVPLKQIADVKLDWVPGYEYTRNRMYTVTVSSTLKNGATYDSINKTMIPWLDEKVPSWGKGYRWRLGGEGEKSVDNSKALAKVMPIGGIIIVLLLVAQFNSVRKTFVILGSIPLSIVGVSIGLLLTNLKFGFMPVVGMVSLAGIVINNAIVLIDNLEIQQIEFKRSDDAAIIEACQRRFRPIVLTTITTLCGLFPLWFYGGSLFTALAVTLVFGLVFGTVLTLGVVPLLYAILFKVDFKNYTYTPVSKKK